MQFVMNGAGLPTMNCIQQTVMAGWFVVAEFGKKEYEMKRAIAVLGLSLILQIGCGDNVLGPTEADPVVIDDFGQGIATTPDVIIDS